MRTNDQPFTHSVPDAGRRYFGVGKNAAYRATRRGEIPTIRIGKRLLVPLAALERMLQGAA
jgi:excisionase family DNA binding protein